MVKKILLVLVMVLFVFSAAVKAEDIATINNNISRLEKEIQSLEAQKAKVKSNAQKARISKIIAGHKKVISEYNAELKAQGVTPQQAKAMSQKKIASKNVAIVKGGLAGGAALIAAEMVMPMGQYNVGCEVGYGLGNNFGIIDLGVKATYPMGKNFVGAEISYAGYSKDVTNVPGLSGTIKSGIGFGVIGGMNIDKYQVEIGYNTILGIRADVGYCIKI